MRQLLPLALLGGLIGCSSQPGNPDGIWINQPVIDSAREGGSLRETLLAHGPNLEWRIDSQRGSATYSNGFELGEGRLIQQKADTWSVDFDGGLQESLSLDDDELTQAGSGSGPQQEFRKPGIAVAADAPPGSSFERALYDAYLGGTWKIREGQGQGGLVIFHPDGQVEGLPGTDRYALCLAGDCAAMAGDHDSIWLQQGQQGSPWLFERDGDELRIQEAVNRAQFDEVPEYHPGRQAWLLERD
ncbi:hypothetical protein [Pseudomonas sp. LRF_L74]|uniref:hypothetical protein n=1 Tax=Pseudomonas sp. LRF_L74 TaxID=3369422 RepID=UPI003F5E08C4